MKMPQKQQGIALLMVLMVVALAIIAVSSMASKQHFNIRRAFNTYSTDQAYLHALSIEAWMRSGVLGEDQSNNDVDFLGELWAKQVFEQKDESEEDLDLDLSNSDDDEEALLEFPFQAYIVDKQGCFNVNNLLAPTPPQSNSPTNNDDYTAKVERVERWRKRFDALLDELNVNQFISKEVFIDWADDNQEQTIEGSSTGGAEDAFYSQQEKPYRTSDTLFVDESEFKLLSGMDETIQGDLDPNGYPVEKTVFEVIKPFVCALPPDTPINLNTAPPEVLGSLMAGETVTELRALAGNIETARFESVDDFLSTDMVRKWAEKIVDEEQGQFNTDAEKETAIDEQAEKLKDDFSVETEYFQIHVKVEYNGGRSLLRSVVMRDNEGKTKTILREQGRYPPPPNPDPPVI